MNNTEHLLVILGEEANEVAHRVAKALRFGLGEVQTGQGLTNAQRIAEEMAQLAAVFALLQEAGALASDSEGYTQYLTWKREKRAKVDKWMAHSREQGVLT